jgi:8-oxo-dGTP pyrophosphatase MutT (NUDIX family)
MHWIQKHVLAQLITNPRLRYAKIKPANVEGNLFMYHLRALLKEGLVEKSEGGFYELTPAGKLYADRLSLQTLTPRVQPRIVTLITCRNDSGEWLLYRRKRQPLLGQVGFPYGKLHLDEAVEDAAARELMEKTGVRATLEHRGDGYITIYEGGDIVSQILFHLFYGSDPKGKIKDSQRSGEVFWGRVEDQENLIKSVPDLIKLLDKHPGDRFFAQLTYKS